MSKVIQVRNVPDEVHRELRTRAAAADVALSEYVLDELRRVSAAAPTPRCWCGRQCVPAAPATQ